ncbi:MAG: ABC transporter permease [Phycisphaeraceae bacterium]|nr:ABC transporter permease [Phycisphaeraceae bacterium]
MKKFKHILLKTLDVAALSVFEPIVRLCYGEDPRAQLRKIGKFILIPIVAFILFLGVWHVTASGIETKFGKMPTPGVTWEQTKVMVGQVFENRRSEKAFYVEQKTKAQEHETKAAQYAAAAELPKNASQKEAFLAESNAQAELAVNARSATFAGTPTIIYRVVHSLKTVFLGFMLATLIALPIGILCGLNPVFMAAASPIIQIFKPVSPVAWVPIAMILVGALYSGSSMQPAMLSSAIVVAMCSLWPTLTNTALGVASIDKDHLNVAKVLRLGWWTRLFKIVIPSSLPLIFAGLRISLGVGWMVLIAAELLVQNPGLGQFVWDRFQDNSAAAFGQIFVAIFIIGIIGFFLDRTMIILQRSVSFDAPAGA